MRSRAQIAFTLKTNTQQVNDWEYRKVMTRSKILDDCSAHKGYRVFEVLGSTKMHNQCKSGKVKVRKQKNTSKK